jgi:hypothetical protein
MATWEDLDSESRFEKEEAGDESNVAMGFVATLTSEVEPSSDFEDENEKYLRAKEKQKLWYLDNGCLRHMTGEKSMFLTLTIIEGGNVKFEGNQSGKIICTRTFGNCSISINNVWLVDGLEHNLLSISQFCDNGYDVIFGKTNCTVINKDENSIVFKGKRIENVYKINLSELVDQKVICILLVNDKKWVWNGRLGHANWRLISNLVSYNLSKANLTLTIIQMHFVVHVRKGRLLNLHLKLKTLFQPPDP